MLVKLTLLCNALTNTSLSSLPAKQAIRLLAEWNGNIKDAVLNGEKGRAWKKANLLISCAEVMPTLKTGKFVFAGYDKVGRAICYYRVKLHDPKKFTALESVKAVVYNYEQMLAAGKLRGAGEICVVIDRTDAKSSNMDIEVCGPWGEGGRAGGRAGGRSEEGKKKLAQFLQGLSLSYYRIHLLIPTSSSPTPPLKYSS